MVKRKKPDSGYFDGYVSFARVLRSWLIAYGIGGPVLFLTNSQIAARLAESGHSRSIAILFLSGVFFQVAVALLYKGAMWFLYVGEEDEHRRKSLFYGISEWITGAFWLELIFDLGTIALFSYATYEILTILTSSPAISH